MLIDEDPLAIEVDSGLHPAETKDLKILLRDKQQGIDRQRRIGRKMQAVHRFVDGVADEFVEIDILLIGDLRLVSRPQGLDGIDDLILKLDREGDKGRILLDDRFDLPFLGVVMGVFLQFDNNPGAAAQPRHLADGKGAGAVGGPFMALAAVPGPTLHEDPAAGHEGGVEADAELADEVDVLLRRFRQLGQEGIGTRVGDGAEVGLELVAAHADPGIGDREGVVLVIEGDVDLERHVGIEDIGGGNALMPEFLQGICRIGDQFANKNVPLGVQRVDDDIEELLDLCLKFVGCSFHCHYDYLLHFCLYWTGTRRSLAIDLSANFGGNGKHVRVVVKPWRPSGHRVRDPCGYRIPIVDSNAPRPRRLPAERSPAPSAAISPLTARRRRTDGSPRFHPRSHLMHCGPGERHTPVRYLPYLAAGH